MLHYWLLLHCWFAALLAALQAHCWFACWLVADLAIAKLLQLKRRCGAILQLSFSFLCFRSSDDI